MSDEALGSMPITEGARRKLRIELASWAHANGLEVPFSIPPSSSSSRAQSREGSRDASRAPSRDTSVRVSRCGSQSAADMRHLGGRSWSNSNSPRSSIDDSITGTLLSAARSLEGISLNEKVDEGKVAGAAVASAAPSTATAPVAVPVKAHRSDDDTTCE
jgi:hypothetical protein